MQLRRTPLVAALAFLGVVAACDRPPQQATAPAAPMFSAATAETQDTALLRRIGEINAQLAGSGLEIAVEAIEFFTIGAGRPSARIHQQPFRWVPNDPRRLAQGDDITYLVDQSDGATASGLTNAQTEAAIDDALDTWDASKPLKKVDVVKRTDGGADPDIFDSFFGFGGFGNPFLADITNAGWLPKAFFDAVTGAGNNVLAFSVTFIFVSGGVPTDINGDNYLDTALNEVYYNTTFGDPGNPVRVGNPWGINVALPGIDVETVGLHENGHSLELGHFGPPPAAVMNPRYAGIRQSPFAVDLAGMDAVWSSWPNP
ncbi:MAG: matrixin family metalloprotease [Gammaproteobacteria bacterium]